MMINIKKLHISNWAYEASIIIQSKLEDILLEHGVCNLVLTGGQTAKSFYQEWQKHRNFGKIPGVNLFLGDERCVPSDHMDSNLRMVSETLLCKGVPAGWRVFNIHENAHPAAALNYAYKFPSQVDILLLTLGEDGHIASIFPNNSLIHRSNQELELVSHNQKDFYARLTITPKVIIQSKMTYVFSIGESKIDALKALYKKNVTVISNPAKLVNKSSVWFTNFDI